MKKQISLWAVFLVNMLYAAALHAATAYYVQSVSAKILSEPSFKSRVIAEVGSGQMLNSSGKEGSWVKVSFGSKEGYVSSLLLSTHPPLKKTEVIRAEDSEINLGVRRRTSSFASAAAARGLTREDRERADIEERVDYKALMDMESLKFGDDEVAQFMEGDK